MNLASVVDIDVPFSALVAAFDEAIALQALTRVVLLFKVASLVAATEAFAWYASALVALFLVFAAKAVALLAVAIIFVISLISSQSSSVFSEAEITAQAATSVVLDCTTAEGSQYCFIRKYFGVEAWFHVLSSASGIFHGAIV